MTGQRESRLLHTAIYWLVPFVLVAVAVVQHYRARVLHQSSWIGCGFGMFATLDNHVSRFVQARVIDNSDSRRVSIPDHLRHLEFHARVVPTARNLRRLAESMQRDATDDKRSELQLRLYHVRFDGQSNRMTVEPRTTVRVP